MTVPSALSLIVEWFPEPSEQAQAISFFGGSSALGNGACHLLHFPRISFLTSFSLGTYDSLRYHLGWYLRTVGILEMDPLVHRYRWSWHRRRVCSVGASVCSKKAQAQLEASRSRCCVLNDLSVFLRSTPSRILSLTLHSCSCAHPLRLRRHIRSPRMGLSKGHCTAYHLHHHGDRLLCLRSPHRSRNGCASPTC